VGGNKDEKKQKWEKKRGKKRENVGNNGGGWGAWCGGRCQQYAWTNTLKRLGGAAKTKKKGDNKRKPGKNTHWKGSRAQPGLKKRKKKGVNSDRKPRKGP